MGKNFEALRTCRGSVVTATINEIMFDWLLWIPTICKTHVNVQTCKVMSISNVILKHFRLCLRTLGTTLVLCFYPVIQKHNEPQHDKTNKLACAPSEDSDQPWHSPSLIRLFAVCIKKPWALSYPLSAQRRLIRLGRCLGCSESSLGPQVILLDVSCCGSNLWCLKHKQNINEHFHWSGYGKCWCSKSVWCH